MILALWPLIPLALMFAGIFYYPLAVIGAAWWGGFLLLCLVRSLHAKQGR